jgi:hypothetical protein
MSSEGLSHVHITCMVNVVLMTNDRKNLWDDAEVSIQLLPLQFRQVSNEVPSSDYFKTLINPTLDSYLIAPTIQKRCQNAIPYQGHRCYHSGQGTREI